MCTNQTFLCPQLTFSLLDFDAEIQMCYCLQKWLRVAAVYLNVWIHFHTERKLDRRHGAMHTFLMFGHIKQ